MWTVIWLSFYFTQNSDSASPFLPRIVPVCYDSTRFCAGCLDPVGKHSPLVNVYWIECVFTVLLWVLTYVTHNSFYSSCREQTVLSVCVFVLRCTHVCVCACMCGDLPDPKNAGIVHHIFGVCRETEAERDCRLHLLLSAAHPEAASDRKLGGLGSKLHLVSEENAAFVSFCMCRIYTVSVSKCNDCFSH